MRKVVYLDSVDDIGGERGKIRVFGVHNIFLLEQKRQLSELELASSLHIHIHRLDTNYLLSGWIFNPKSGTIVLL